MGLDIQSKSDKEYHASYGGLHQIRWMAYKSVHGVRDYAMWHELYRTGDQDSRNELAEKDYPNLMLHSDCDGGYTPDGKVSTDGGEAYQTGNSVQLLKELETIKQRLDEHPNKYIIDRYWDRFNMLYDLVKDVVENHDGVLEFC